MYYYIYTKHAIYTKLDEFRFTKFWSRFDQTRASLSSCTETDVHWGPEAERAAKTQISEKDSLNSIISPKFLKRYVLYSIVTPGWSSSGHFKLITPRLYSPHTHTVSSRTTLLPIQDTYNEIYVGSVFVLVFILFCLLLYATWQYCNKKSGI